MYQARNSDRKMVQNFLQTALVAKSLDTSQHEFWDRMRLLIGQCESAKIAVAKWPALFTEIKRTLPLARRTPLNPSDVVDWPSDLLDAAARDGFLFAVHNTLSKSSC